MNDSTRHDAWSAGENYEAYMGRWSRQIATKFVDWLNMPIGLEWLEIGCGTGALSSAILKQARPKSLICIDQSAEFVDTANQNIADPVVEFKVGDAENLDFTSGSRQCVVSALVLNFVSNRQKALSEMLRVANAEGTVAFYVWDYPGGGVQFMRAFWHAAITCDPNASDFAENKRFPYCTEENLTVFAIDSGLKNVQSNAIEVASNFSSFDDLWHPFTLGAGPAPGYCSALEPAAREKLKETLRDQLRIQSDGSVPLTLRAWAIKGSV